MRNENVKIITGVSDTNALHPDYFSFYDVTTNYTDRDVILNIIKFSKFKALCFGLWINAIILNLKS